MRLEGRGRQDGERATRIEGSQRGREKGDYNGKTRDTRQEGEGD